MNGESNIKLKNIFVSKKLLINSRQKNLEFTMFVFFFERIYIKFTFSKTNAIEAPRLDLECLKSLYAYRNINSNISVIGYTHGRS
jgi:hypothetical protein